MELFGRLLKRSYGSADLVAVARSAIGHADWASHLGDFEPQRPPFTAERSWMRAVRNLVLERFCD